MVSYDVSSLYTNVNQIKNLHIDQETYMVSYDVSSLCTNVPRCERLQMYQYVKGFKLL